MGYLLVQQLNSGREMRPKGWAYLYFHRLYRILPAYAFVLFMCWAFTKYLGNGPMWVFGDRINQDCHKWWWTNLIFMNNYVLPDYESNGCLPQTWYLAVDMQFFWFTPPIFFIYYKLSKIAGWVLLNLSIVMTIVASAVIAHVKDYNVVGMANTTGTENYDIYIKPYCRAAPYALGLMCGLVLYTQRNYAKTGKIYDTWALAIGNCFHNRYFRYAGYLFGLFLINFFLFIQYNAYEDVDNGWTKWNHAENVLWYAFNRTCWGLGISLLLLPMLLGHWKVPAWFLSLDIWTPLARLTFCTYLVHINLGMVYVESINTAYWFNDLNITIDFFFLAFTAYSAAIPLTLAVESPFMAMEKLMKGKRG
jgi:peptidoglycan/LPS O-acetylase OafA/YrhL